MLLKIRRSAAEAGGAAEPVRFAYVGCGFVAQTIHIPNFAALPRDCRFVALAEARPELGREVAARYGIPKVYASHEEIAADPDVEAVGVSGPYALQGHIAEDLLRAGKHVFMEKPMAVSVARAEAIVDAARSGGGRLMIGYMKRCDPGNRRIKALADSWRASGERGRLLLARNHGFGGNWTYAQDPNVLQSRSAAAPPPAPDECPAWLPEKRRSSYLGYLQQWTHNIDLLRWLLGDTDGRAYVTSIDLDDGDGMTGILVLDVAGTRAVVESGYTRFHGWDEHTQLYFEKGWLRTEAPALMQKEQPATIEVYQAADGDALPRLTQEFAAPAWSYREEAKAFLHAIRTGEPFPSPAEDALHDVRLSEEIYRRWLEGKGEV